MLNSFHIIILVSIFIFLTRLELIFFYFVMLVLLQRCSAVSDSKAEADCCLFSLLCSQLDQRIGKDVLLLIINFQVMLVFQLNIKCDFFLSFLMFWFSIHLSLSQLNAFCTQVVQGFESISQATREDMIAKLFKRLRNLM